MRGGQLLLEQRLPREPVLQYGDEHLRLAELSVYNGRPVRQRPEVLRWYVHDRRLLCGLRLRLGLMLYERVVLGLLPLKRRLPSQPVLQHRHQAMWLAELSVYDGCPVRPQPEMLRGFVYGSRVLRRLRLRFGLVLSKWIVQAVLQIARRLPRQSVLRPSLQAVHDHLRMHKRRSVWNWVEVLQQ